MYKIYVDAAYQPEQKIAAIAFNAIKEGQQIPYQAYIGEVSDNHEAEFRAYLAALHYLVEQQAYNEMIIIHSDSKIVVQSIEKRYVKDSIYATYLQEILSLSDQFSLLFSKWIADKDNKHVDQLARQLLKKHTQ